jgi:phosphomannomutase
MTATGTLERVDASEPPVPGPNQWRTRAGKVLSNGEALVTFIVVAACVVFTFKELQPSQLFKNTTPAGGDMGAHVWLPAYVKSSLLPHLRITGWTPDWYDGFPALTYYFPGPIVAIALLSYVIPYDIAFKLITVLGLLSLPVAAWAFGRLARLRFPGPACLALATLPYLFGREFTIYGGNIASTMAGEFCFSIALSLALVFLGVVARGLETGRHRALAAVLLAAVGICHILPLFFAIAGAVVLTLMRFDRRRLQWTLPVFAVGAALIAFWALPFYVRLPYATNMGYQKLTNYLGSLFPGADTWLFVLAGAGAVLALARKNRVGNFLTIMTVLSAVVFRLAPQARLWNARVLPFWFLCLYLLAGVAFMEAGILLVEHLRTTEIRRGALIGVPIVTGVIAFGWVNFPLHNLPFGHESASGKYTWMGITSTDSSFVPSWVYWNYSGYQSTGKAREKEYFALVAEMTKLGQNPADGCGRAMWEYEPELDQMGTPDALMLLPYWTKGCIGSQEGLYYESSATTPYHFLNAAELSTQPSNPVRGLDYPTAPNVAEGIQHLQMLGVKYFMAETPDIEAAADADSNLQLVGQVGPFPVTYTSGSKSTVEQRTWKIYKVDDSAVVAPLIYQPVVMTGPSQNAQAWLDASESWYLNPSRWDVYEAASGPKTWARVSPTTTNPPRVALPPVHVSDIHEGTESISFDVDQVGVPVLVKTSYFPNWTVSGASGVYRVTPNLMVVVPTATHVTLNYGYTPVDWIGFILSLFGLLGVVVLWRLPAVEYPRPRHLFGGEHAYEGPRHLATKVPGRMAAPDSAALAAVFKAYDIRGTVPDQMNTDLAGAVGAAFATFAGAPRLLVARDMRPSGVELTAAFAAGVTSTGVDVIDLGLASTDEMYFASGSLDAPGAMFTASHNPAQYNGIKLCLSGARPVGADTGLQDIMAAVIAIGRQGYPTAPQPGTVNQADVLAAYAAKVRSFVSLPALQPLKVVADTANGMGGLVVPAVFADLPFQLEILFGELDGTFPNHPADPIQAENLVALQRRILDSGADIGLAFDGDADRCFLVDDLGVPLSGSTTTALVAAAMLEKNPGATILHNLICSKAVPEIIRERGGIPVRTRVGHSYIKAIMADTDALFGGEHSGHYYFRDNYRADSGSIAALVVLEVLSLAGRPLSAVRTDFERYADSGEINTEVGDPAAVIEAVAEHFQGARQDRLDGLTVDLGAWWFNLRPSNTEPLLRLNLEAADRDMCSARTEEILSLIRGAGSLSRP